MKIKKSKKYFQIVVSIVLLFIIINWVNFDQVISGLKNINYWFLVLAFLTFFIDRIIMAAKWNLLLKEKKIEMPWYEALKIYYVSNFLGIILPATLGTDLVKIHIVAKKNYPKTDIIASILVERFLGFLGLFTYGFASIFLLVTMFAKLTANFHQIFIASGIIFTLGIIVFSISFNERFFEIIIRFLKSVQNKKLWQRISINIQNLILSYQSYKTKKFTLLVFFVLTLIEIFVSIFINFLVATGFGLNVPLAYFVAYIPIMMLLVRIPISFSGFGISEGGTVYFLGLAGVPAALAFSIGIVNHFIMLAGLLPGALFYILSRDTKVKQELEVKG